MLENSLRTRTQLTSLPLTHSHFRLHSSSAGFFALHFFKSPKKIKIQKSHKKTNREMTEMK